jgi:uncharacterized membrane protein YfcA
MTGALAGRRASAFLRPERVGRLFAMLLIATAVFLIAENVAALV